MSEIQDMDVQLAPRADPLLRRAFPTWAHYRSHAQAWAVQMLRNAPPEGIVLTAMATGSGKTLTYILPLLEERERRGKAGALVIVPTISLAVDQADAVSRRYPSGIGNIRATEVHSALGPAERESRESAFARGEYDVLLVSPERALNPGFIERLRGMGDALRFLVIDEVHTMCDWGETFRLDYPRLGWLRQELLRSSPELRTHLMSATVPLHTERRLKKLFAVDGNLWRTVRGSVLRFEAEIQIQKLPYRSHNATIRWLRENIKELEVPALIYLTVPRHAEEIGKAMQSWGYRCGVYHGETLESERQRISDQWAKGQLDYVVGTSAFGLGIDKPGVRSVTHFCIPESLDRYYQEIGRAGRDGKRCLANLITVEEDQDVAYSNAKKLLTEEKFQDRWTTLVNEGECLEDTGDEVYWLINESRLPQYAPPRAWYLEDAPQDFHTRWNKSLLNFLARQDLAVYKGLFPAEVGGVVTDRTLKLFHDYEWQVNLPNPPGLGKRLEVPHSTAPGPGWASQGNQMLDLIRTLDAPEVTWRSVFRVERACIARIPAEAEEFQRDVESRRDHELRASYDSIDVMIGYARSQQTKCYRRPIAELYGEHLESCGNCGWCIDHGLTRGNQITPRKPDPWDSYRGPRISPIPSGIRRLANRAGRVMIHHRDILPASLFQRLGKDGFQQFLVPAADAPDKGTSHHVEDARSELTVLERMPTVVSIIASMGELDVLRVLGILDEHKEKFSERHPCLIFLPDNVLWNSRSAYLEKFPGPTISLAMLESMLTEEIQ